MQRKPDVLLRWNVSVRNRDNFPTQNLGTWQLCLRRRSHRALALPRGRPTLRAAEPNAVPVGEALGRTDHTSVQQAHSCLQGTEPGSF